MGKYSNIFNQATSIFESRFDSQDFYIKFHAIYLQDRSH